VLCDNVFKVTRGRGTEWEEEPVTNNKKASLATGFINEVTPIRQEKEKQHGIPYIICMEIAS
jgi:hypothetical protein